MSVDLRQTIAPKSKQLNADDLITGPRTIRVTQVSLATAEQPIAVNFEGDEGKPFMPCKSMRRVMFHAWGPNSASYIGRSMTLYRDEDVLFGGAKNPGVRISHMSDIQRPLVMLLTESKAKRKPFTVQPLEVVSDEAIVARIKAAMAKATTQKALEAIINHKDAMRLVDHIAADYDAALARVSPPPTSTTETE